MLNRARAFYAGYPSAFWTLIGATFIDHLGGALLFPFFALFVTERFGVGMTEVGVLFAIYAVANVIGSLFSGAITDKLGRRWMLLFGLVVSATSSLLMIVVKDLALFYTLAALVGLLANAGGPAQQAMVADLLKQEKLAEGYGIQRVSINLAVAIGPAIGGLLAAKSFTLLFIIDAISSLITALIVFFALPETKPAPREGEPEENLLNTLQGYGDVVRDRLFMAFWILTVLAIMAYNQLNSTLSVYLRDVHGYTAQQFGYLMSLNATIVVLFQFWIAKRVSGKPAMVMMSLGTILYALGFAMFGFVSTYLFFVLAIVIITIGEMIISPVAQSLVARLAPEDMRGRYMAIYGFSWTVPFAIGPLLAGLIMDNLSPYLVWYFFGFLAFAAAGGFLVLNRHKDVSTAQDLGSERASEPA